MRSAEPKPQTLNPRPEPETITRRSFDLGKAVGDILTETNPEPQNQPRERELFIVSLLVRIHFIIEMIW